MGELASIMRKGRHFLIIAAYTCATHSGLEIYVIIVLTRSIRDSETSIDFLQGPPGSRRERVKSFSESTS